MVGELIAVVVPLGLDTFAVAAALGMLGTSPRSRLRISLLFTGFEATMPLVGLALGAPLGRVIGNSAEFVAIAVLLGFGSYSLVSDDDREEAQLGDLALVRGRSAILLGLSISLDELAVGFALGLLGLPVILTIVVIAAQALILSQAGLRLGGRVSEQLRESAERVAGLALTALGLILLAERLL